MFRVTRTAAFALVASIGLLSLGIAGDALAGSKHSYSGGLGYKGGNYSVSGRGGYHANRHSFGKNKQFAVLGGHARHGGWSRHPAAASGVMLGHRFRPLHNGHHRLSVRVYAGSGYTGPVRSGPKIIRFDETSGQWQDHHVSGGTSTGSTGDATAGDAVLAGRARLEGGACAPGVYCTVRLGPYTSSPKIITINASGRTIPQDQAE